MLRCPLCAGPVVHAFTTRDHNRRVRDEAFVYVRCSACGVLSLRDVPDDLQAFYPQDYFVLPAIDELRAQARSQRYPIELVQRQASGGRLVEIGPGNGTFALQALDAGFDVAAIEIDPAAAQHLRATLGIEVIESGVPHDALADLGPLDAVVAWHVIEHVPQPWELLRAAAQQLAPGGVLVLATPNPAAFGLRVLGARWPHVDAPRHLFLIPHGTLIARARAFGLQPVLLTASDPIGRIWNAFAWQYLLRRPGASRLRELAARAAGIAIAGLLAPVERRGVRGAAYTVVLRKPPRSAPS
jgi:SAM-dependent methyltransferase